MSKLVPAGSVEWLDRMISDYWPSSPDLRRDGVGLIGYASGEFGIAETLRAHAASLDAAGVEFSIRNTQVGIASRQNETSAQPRVSRRMPYWANIIFVNAVLTQKLYREIGQRRLRRHYNIGYWLWELESFPEAWKPAFGFVDEIWTPTQFVYDGLAACTTKPVTRIPMPVAFVEPEKMDLARFGVARGTHVFLCSFDFNSYLSRKNPAGAIEAFRNAFPDAGSSVVLLLKSINGDRYPAALSALRNIAASDRRVILYDGFFSRDEMLALLKAADTYVSLHRSEGFGLHIAESMYMGKTVIATAYSGNMEFMDGDNSLLVDYSLRPLKEGEYPEWDGQYWAEPDLAHAARLMAGCVDGSVQLGHVGRNAARSIRSRCSPAACTEAAIARLAEIGVGASG